MSEKINLVPFSDLLKQIVDNRGKTCPTVNSGIPLIATNCIKNENIFPVFENVRYVSQDVFNYWFRGHPEPGDIIFVNKGTPGRVCWVPNPLNFCIAQDMVALRVDEKKVYPKYLFAALRSETLQGEIENLHVGSLIPHFKKGDFNLLNIPIPDDYIQKITGDLYFYFSVKIDFLHRQNKTLEQLAETLFRQWFVEEADKSWETVTISDVAEINVKTISKNYPFPEIEYLDTGSVSKGIISDFQTYQLADAPSRAQRIASDDDIVYSLVRPIQRHYGLLYGLKPNTIVSTGFCVLSCPNFCTHFLYILLTSDETVEYLDMIAEGSTSTYPSLKPSDIANFEFQKPPQEKLQRFSVIASSVWKKINTNHNQIRTLTQLRDTLLPKLMSGEVRLNIE